MTPKTYVPVLLIFSLSFSFPQTKGNRTNPTAFTVPPFLRIPLDAEGAFLVLESVLTTAEFAMTAQLATAGVLSEAALAVADVLIHKAANGISNGSNSTLAAVQQCSQTSSKQLKAALRRFNLSVQKCIAEDVDQLRVSYKAVQESTSNATEVLANALGDALACITSGKNASAITECIGLALPQTLATVSEALAKVATNSIRAAVLTSALPTRANVCATAALAGTGAAVAAVWDNLRACLATAPIEV